MPDVPAPGEHQRQPEQPDEDNRQHEGPHTFTREAPAFPPGLGLCPLTTMTACDGLWGFPVPVRLTFLLVGRGQVFSTRRDDVVPDIPGDNGIHVVVLSS